VRRTLTVLLTVLLLPAGPSSAAGPPTDAEQMPSLHCLARVPVPLVENVMETKWSPDSTRLAVVWFARIPSTRTATGYQEQEITDLVDLRRGSLYPLGVGDQPRWSTTGSYVSYWGPNADELRVVRDSRVVARLGPTIPEVRWVGDGLLFIEKGEIREWREGAVRSIARIDDAYVPKYPRDDVYWSADGRFFTLTRYSLDGTLERYLGTTRTGRVAPLAAQDVMYTEWAPSGARLLLRTKETIELRDLDGGTAARPVPDDARVHGWAPDGRLLLGNVSPTVPGGDAFDAFRVWDAQSPGAIATLPNVLGERTFSPDGRFFAGVSRTGQHTTRLEVYGCHGAPDAPRDPGDADARLSKIDASAGRFARPIAGEITQFLQGIHTGVDLAAPFGSLITADDGGVVSFVEWVDVGGNRVCVQHRGALESCVYHTSAPLVRVGERVARGEPIALVGMTGVTTGPHTHWEVKLAGRIVDPLTY
jgi:murein DD-endopeptidase MepM/ murein hydrolase activator NlpD